MNTCFGPGVQHKAPCLGRGKCVNVEPRALVLVVVAAGHALAIWSVNSCHGETHGKSFGSRSKRDTLPAVGSCTKWMEDSESICRKVVGT